MKTHRNIEVASCSECATVDWFEAGRPVPAEVALARLFGDFDLVGSLEAISAPGRRVMLYKPGSGQKSALHTLPLRQWLLVADDLYASHDGELLLLSTNQGAHPEPVPGA